MPGDLIEIFRGPYKHWGIYYGNNDVIHVASRCELYTTYIHIMIFICMLPIELNLY